MQFEMTAAELESRTDVMAILLAKLLQKVQWGAYDLSHAEIQWLLTNDKEIDLAVLYSPVLPLSTLNALCPANWPGQPVDEEGEQVRMTYGEYLRITEVEGGFCLQFADGPKNANNSIQLPRNAYLIAQIAQAGGFLTQAEVDAIKIVPEGQ